MDTEIATKKKLFLTLRQRLTCHICMEIPKKEIYISSIGERTTCAACACNLPEIEPYIRNQLAEELLISLQIPCEFAKNGCGKKLDPGSMEIHKKDCKLRTIDCILPNCPSKIIINYRGLTHHLAKNHEVDIFKKAIIIEDGSNVIDVTFNVKEENFNRQGAFQAGPYLLRDKRFFAFMIFHFHKQIAQIYLQLYGSQRETHGLRYKIEIGDEVQQALTSTGPVLSLDDKRKYINENLEGLVIPFTVMRKHINALDQLQLKIEIKDDTNPKIKKEQPEPEQQSPDEESEPETKKIKTPEDDDNEDDEVEEIKKNED